MTPLRECISVCSDSRAGQMEVCEGELDIDRWELFSLVKTGGWTKVTSPETVAKAARCVLGPRVLSATGRDALEANIKCFLANLIKRWVQCGRREDRFRTKHEKWMASKETVSVEFVAETEEPCADSHSSSFRQRPSFSDLSERSKRRRSMEVASEHEAEELLKAAGQRARKEKKHDLAYLTTEAGASPGRIFPNSITRVVPASPVAAGSQWETKDSICDVI